jgi:hypothetical protein
MPNGDGIYNAWNTFKSLSPSFFCKSHGVVGDSNYSYFPQILHNIKHNPCWILFSYLYSLVFWIYFSSSRENFGDLKKVASIFLFGIFISI